MSKMKHSAIGSVVGVLLLSGTMVFAQRKPGAVTLRPPPPPPRTFTVYGVGNKSCGAWLSEGAESPGNGVKQPNNINTAWVMGFISGVGAFNPLGVLKETDGPAIEIWMNNYCRANTLDHVAEAAMALSKALAAPK
jgi:hypothetical protein